MDVRKMRKSRERPPVIERKKKRERTLRDERGSAAQSCSLGAMTAYARIALHHLGDISSSPPQGNGLPVAHLGRWSEGCFCGSTLMSTRASANCRSPSGRDFRCRRVHDLGILPHTWHNAQIRRVGAFIGAAMSPELAGRIKRITLCMDELEMLQRFYTSTAIGRTFSANVAIPPDRTRALELISALFRVFENAWALNKVRLILCGTADRFAPFELMFTQDSGVLAPRGAPEVRHGARARGRCHEELSIVIVRYWSRSPRETVDFRRIHGLFERLGPSLETVTFKTTIKRLTAAAFDNDSRHARAAQARTRREAWGSRNGQGYQRPLPRARGAVAARVDAREGI
ncbi:hypothetical protein AB1N83_012563 [Pleurotus pulmonarius]